MSATLRHGMRAWNIPLKGGREQEPRRHRRPHKQPHQMQAASLMSALQSQRRPAGLDRRRLRAGGEPARRRPDRTATERQLNCAGQSDRGWIEVGHRSFRV